MKNELIETLRQKVPELPFESSSKLIDTFCSIHEPEESRYMEFLTIDSIRKKGSSVKPGNIMLNRRRLIVDSSEIGLMIAGVVTEPYLIPLAALIIWNKIWSGIKIDLGESHAMTIKFMWDNRDSSNNTISETKAHQLYNEYLISTNRSQINSQDFSIILNELSEMKCIEKTKEGDWWLREWVRKSI